MGELLVVPFVHENWHSILALAYSLDDVGEEFESRVCKVFINDGAVSPDILKIVIECRQSA